MRDTVSGFVAAAAYWLMIVTFLAMSMPTRAQVEAYIEAAQATQISAAPVQVDGPLAG